MRWQRAKPHSRCPLCGSRDPNKPSAFKSGCEWTDGKRPGTTYVICLRVQAGSFKTSTLNGFNRTGYHHIIHSGSGFRVVVPDTPLAATKEICEAYLALCDGTITAFHRAYLKHRGISDAQIARCRYTSLSKFSDRRAEVAERIALEHALTGVPGFWNTSKNEWKLEGPGGILLPVINANGQIQACQIHLDKAIELYMRFTAGGRPIPDSEKENKRWKYIWLTSAPTDDTDKTTGTAFTRRKTGVGVTAVLHFPLWPRLYSNTGTIEGFFGDFNSTPFVLDKKEGHLLVEGILKSDIVRDHWSGPETIFGIPGDKACHSQVCSIATTTNYMLFGFDIDWKINLDVKQSMKSLIDKLQNHGLKNIYILIWPEDSGKGLDDVLLAGKAETVNRITADEWIRKYWQ